MEIRYFLLFCLIALTTQAKTGKTIRFISESTRNTGISTAFRRFESATIILA
jgi:hypothetical protein